RGEQAESKQDTGVSTPGLSGRRVPHDHIRRATARHMKESLLHVAPHVTSVFACDLSRITADREKMLPEVARAGAKLTYTAYFVRATVEALLAVPEVNSRWHEEELEIFEDCNIGIATSLEAR